MKNLIILIVTVIVINSCELRNGTTGDVNTKYIEKALIAIKNKDVKKLKKYMLDKYITDDARFETKVFSTSTILMQYKLSSQIRYSMVEPPNVEMPENMAIVRAVIYENIKLDEKFNYVFVEFKYNINISKSKFISFDIYRFFSQEDPYKVDMIPPDYLDGL